MKRHSLNTACGLLSLVGTVSLLSGTFSSAWADVACTNASLSGSYATLAQGSGIMFPDTPPVSQAIIAIMKADGQGNLTITGTGTAGNITPIPFVASGTYKINPDCSGTAKVSNILTFPDGTTVPLKESYALLIAGPEIQFVITVPGQVLAGTGIRQTSPCKWCRWW